MEVEEDWLKERLQDNAHMRKQVKELQNANTKEVERRRVAEHRVKELEEEADRLWKEDNEGEEHGEHTD